jgi:hypothetical protein
MLFVEMSYSGSKQIGRVIRHDTGWTSFMIHTLIEPFTTVECKVG